MRLTKAAYSLCLTALACIGLGVVFGRIELFLFAGVCIASLVFAAFYVLVSPLNLIVRRDTSPQLLRVGIEVLVNLEIYNKGRFRTPVLQATDRLKGRQAAVVHIAPIRPKHLANITYEVPTSKRGEMIFGPFDLTITDPLGLVKTTIRGAEPTKALIRPRIIDLAAVPTAGGELVGDFSATQKLSPSGDEFVRLRPYVIGDELRRVHWRASARTGDLVVRQNEETRTGVMCVLFDLIESRYSEDGFERAVSATLSAVRSGESSDDQLYYATSTSAAIKIGSTTDVDTVDLQLARIQTSESGSTAAALTQLSNYSRSGGTLILVTGGNDGQVEQLVAVAKHSFACVVPVLCDAYRDQPPYGHIRYDETTDLSLGWDAATGAAT